MAFGLPTIAWLAWAALPLWVHAPSQPTDMAVVGPGTYEPLRAVGKPVQVGKFLLDREPVTNAQFLAFVRTHEKFQRDRVDRLFADDGYLSSWAGPMELGQAALPDAPVVRVSWFAAKAYCAARGARLPRVAEWEVAAQASATEHDAHKDPAFRREVLDWFERPSHGLPDRIGGKPNAWGVRDLHGLVWEWVFDFNADLVDGDDRGRGDVMRFCGAGSVGAPDPSDAPLFLRTAFRSALRPDSTTNRLGFRCANDH
ncbi:MAG: formylglycine-generating enzyme family protein [Polyangiales bacterium]